MKKMIPATIIAPRQLTNADDQIDVGSYSRHFLAAGDSWFSSGSAFGYGLLHHLEFPERTLITSLAVPGNTLRRISEWRTREFGRLLDQWHFDGVMLSAGGNDLIAYLPSIIDPLAPGFVSQSAIRRFEGYLRANLVRLVNTVRQSRENADTPVYAHVYDYATPRPAPALDVLGLKVGPWLYPALARVPQDQWISTTDALFDSMAAVKRSVPGLTVVETAGACERAPLGATGDVGCWLNEIHPNKTGYPRIGKRWQNTLG